MEGIIHFLIMYHVCGYKHELSMNKPGRPLRYGNEAIFPKHLGNRTRLTLYNARAVPNIPDM